MTGPTPVPDRIELRGLRTIGRVGVPAAERARGQPLEIDIDLAVDLADAARSDDVADTVDYAAVCERVVATVVERPVALLEHLASRVAAALLALDERVGAVEVAVRKLRPPVPQDLASSGVRVRRSRR
jgi:dihydroneopterin aldolase